ncbi:killer cell lectin-like receptor family I member 1 [Rattus norvegicus]|uniref:Killer cell lectin-like receptor family I member 1 n=1 Tax=Rattus norvegicus TaxID=10116 RepID=A6IM77_RAT|nr:killer cell lectin-like receptor family I member 1 [Rattus norvegicus]
MKRRIIAVVTCVEANSLLMTAHLRNHTPVNLIKCDAYFTSIILFNYEHQDVCCLLNILFFTLDLCQNANDDNF